MCCGAVAETEQNEVKVNRTDIIYNLTRGSRGQWYTRTRLHSERHFVRNSSSNRRSMTWDKPQTCWLAGSFNSLFWTTLLILNISLLLTHAIHWVRPEKWGPPIANLLSLSIRLSLIFSQVRSHQENHEKAAYLQTPFSVSSLTGQSRAQHVICGD